MKQILDWGTRVPYLFRRFRLQKSKQQ